MGRTDDNSGMISLREWLLAIQAFLHGTALPEMPAFGGLAYLGLALLVLVEGPIATLLGAVAASAGLMRPAYVFASAAAGNLVADSLWYTLGYLGKMDWLVRHGRIFHIERRHVMRLENEIRRHARKMLLIAKLTASFSIPALIAAGMARVPWRRWFTAIFFGEMIWTGSLVVGGYYFSESLKKMERGVQIASIIGVVIVVVLLVRLAIRIGQRWQEANPQRTPGEAE
jgi:membrane protein DedA with SNARE-associated domain